MNNNSQNTEAKLALLQSNKKYKAARGSLLLLIALSVINIFSIAFADMLFYFSSYLSQMIPMIGVGLTAETGNNIYVIVTAILSVVLLVPYVLCYICSKNHYGWMIGALVMFSIDTVLLIIDLFSYIGTELMLEYILNTAFHAYVIYLLAVAVKYGVDLKKQQTVAEDTAAQSTGENVEETSCATEEGTRSVTFARTKRFTGSGLVLSICIDGNEIDTLKNGETKTVQVGSNEHILTLLMPSGDVGENITLPADMSLTYAVDLKSAMMGIKVLVTRQ